MSDMQEEFNDRVAKRPLGCGPGTGAPSHLLPKGLTVGEELENLRATLAKSQSTIALIQRIAGCQVDRLAEVVEDLVRERTAALERGRELEGERDLWIKRYEWQGETLSKVGHDNYTSAAVIIKALLELSTNLEAERDELKADAIRFKIHLDQKDRALAANAEEYRKLEVERDELRCTELRDLKIEVCALRDLFRAASEQEKKLTPGNVGHRGFLSGYLYTGCDKSQRLYESIKKKVRALSTKESSK